MQEDPNPPKTSPRTVSGLVAGLLGGICGYAVWILLVILCIISSSGKHNLNPIYLLPFICSTVGFLIGTESRATFMSCLIGWLIAASPLYSVMGIGYAHEMQSARTNLVWFAVFSPLLLGPLSTVAGARFVRNRWSSLVLWLVPTGIVTAAIITASSRANPG
ncbi:MAG: hypothetical protein ABFD64_00220 [Armatimonadota bacterium]